MYKNPELRFLSQNIFMALLFIGMGFLFSCNNETYYPKPRGYFRIDFPEKEYKKFTGNFPYTFEYPAYAEIVFDEYTRGNPYWFNLDFPHFDGRIHFSYKAINEDVTLYSLAEDARQMAFKHAPKAIGITESYFNNSQKKVFGLAYTIDGKDAASPYQFYLTDSTQHFLRGALYFKAHPNNDSMQPVINFIVDDIRHMVESFEWKNVEGM